MRKFTVHVSIEETTREEPKVQCRCPQGTRCGHAMTPAGDKKTNTVLNLTVQAETLEAAIGKATRHLNADMPSSPDPRDSGFDPQGR